MRTRRDDRIPRQHSASAGAIASAECVCPLRSDAEGAGPGQMAVLAERADLAPARAVIDMLGKQLRQRSGLQEQERSQRFRDVGGRV